MVESGEKGLARTAAARIPDDREHAPANVAGADGDSPLPCDRFQGFPAVVQQRLFHLLPVHESKNVFGLEIPALGDLAAVHTQVRAAMRFAPAAGLGDRYVR